MGKYTWQEALKEADSRLEEGRLLEDNNSTKWDIYNLMDMDEGIEGAVIDGEHYYCVGYDGRIGYTRDNGYNVEWLYRIADMTS